MVRDLIYLYARDFERFAGGAEHYVQAHCLAAARSGRKPVLHSLGATTELLDLGYAAIDRRRCPGEYRGEYALMYRPLLWRPIARAYRENRRPLLIHSFGAWATAGAAATRALRAQGVDVKHVTSCFELLEPHTRAKLSNAVVRDSKVRHARQRMVYEFVRRVSAPAESAAMRESDAVIVNYDRLRDEIHADYDPAINVVKLPYATCSAFEPAPSGQALPGPVTELAVDSGPLIVSTSRQEPRKGVDVLIRALARLRDDGMQARAILIGDGKLLQAHRQLVAELGLGDRVALPGRVPDVLPYLQHADVFALPSLAEGSGSMSVLEALQYAVPVISSAVDGMVEDLSGDENALLVKTGSVDELQRGLKRLVADAQLRDRLGAAGRELYVRRFSADAATTALAEFYAGLDGEPSSSAATAPAPAA